MAHPRASATGIDCTQLVTRFDRNGERRIDLPLLRQVRVRIRRDMNEAGAHGTMIWRLARTPSGITITAVWHSRREKMIEMGRRTREERVERRRRAAAAGIVNRRR